MSALEPAVIRYDPLLVGCLSTFRYRQLYVSFSLVLHELLQKSSLAPRLQTRCYTESPSFGLWGDASMDDLILRGQDIVNTSANAAMECRNKIDNTLPRVQIGPVHTANRHHAKFHSGFVNVNVTAPLSLSAGSLGAIPENWQERNPSQRERQPRGALKTPWQYGPLILSERDTARPSRRADAPGSPRRRVGKDASYPLHLGRVVVCFAKRLGISTFMAA